VVDIKLIIDQPSPFPSLSKEGSRLSCFPLTAGGVSRCKENTVGRRNPAEKCYDRDVRGEVTSLLSQHPSE